MLYYTLQILWFIHHSFTYVAAYLCFPGILTLIAGSLEKGESLSMSNPLLLLSKKVKKHVTGCFTESKAREGWCFAV